MNNNLKRRIMARIYFEYTKNILLGYPDYFMFALFLVASFTLVSVRDVLNNLPKNNFSDLFNFLIAALRNTSLAVQILITGFFIRIIVGSSMLVYKNKDLGVKWLTSKFSKI